MSLSDFSGACPISGHFPFPFATAFIDTRVSRDRIAARPYRSHCTYSCRCSLWVINVAVIRSAPSTQTRESATPSGDSVTVPTES